MVGQTASYDNIADLSAFARSMAEFIKALQRIDATDGPKAGKHSFYRGADPAYYHDETIDSLDKLEGRIETDKARAVWNAALGNKWTGEPVWFNHTLVFHLSAAPGEYRRIYALRGDLRSWFFWQLSRFLVARKRSTPAADQAMHCTYLDGSEIADADMEHVRDVVWKHMVITPWKKGDVVALDNHAVGHGRLPYTGPRQVAVCWA